jgi:hypothetical protein
VIVLATAGAGAGALVLVVSAVLKLVDPAPTRALLEALAPGSGRSGAGALAVGELGVAFAALTWGGPWAFGALAAANLGFAAVLVVARRRAPGLSCGCFGRHSGPPDRVQVGADLVVAAAAGLAAVVDAPALARAVEDAPLAGTATAAGAVVLAACYAAVATRAGRARGRAARSGGRPRPRPG